MSITTLGKNGAASVHGENSLYLDRDLLDYDCFAVHIRCIPSVYGSIYLLIVVKQVVTDFQW